ncbi:hypothetical protein AURDEDRAFT_124889 [Auricularia subglabra TFB-10046 SS5]|nr:hypothetical protein AURDEDRAFT_124889 [Auricularia subglabra TFB-10046 SS5]
MPLNAPQLPPDHPINRVTPNFTCPKCNVPGALARALQYGDRDKFPGKVYHWCATTPACKGVRSYTPEPLPAAQAPAVPVVHYPAYYPAGFAPPGFVPHPPPAVQPGQLQALGPAPPLPHMGWGFPPGYAPPYAAHPWPPAAPPVQATAARQAVQTPCSGPLCRAKQSPGYGNQGCTLKFCKTCCQAQLLDDERALRSHDGCRTHKRDAFRPNPDGDVLARAASPPMDPVLREPPVPAPGQHPAPDAPRMAGPVPDARPGIGRSLELNWAAIGEAQTQQQLALGTKRRQVVMSKLHRVTVVLWPSNDLPYRLFEVPVASLACFSLATDASEFLETLGITASMFERFDPTIEEWTMVKREATMPVLAQQHLLFRVCGVTTCINFAKALDLANCTSSIPRAAAPYLKRLGEEATSPPRRKRVRVSSPLDGATVDEPAPSLGDPDTPSRSPSIVDGQDKPERSTAAQDYDNTPLRIEKPDQHFPGDFYFCDVVNALKRSVTISDARKKQPRDGRARKRYEVLGELLKTTIPSSTLGHVQRAVDALKRDNPAKYYKFMRLGQTSDRRYEKLSSRSASSTRSSRANRAAGPTRSMSRHLTRSPSPAPAHFSSSSPSPSLSTQTTRSSATRTTRSSAMCTTRSPSARTTRSSTTRTTRSAPARSARAAQSNHASSPAPASGARDSPIELDDSAADGDVTSLCSSEPASPLSKRIQELEEEQELLRPAPPIDIELLPKVIDWNNVILRAERPLPKLWRIVSKPERNAFCQELCRALRAKRDKIPLTLKQKCLVLELVHAGYSQLCSYGPNGLGLAMSMTIPFKDARLYSEDAYKIIQPLRTEIFVERVLVRELILLLIKEDFSPSDEDTVTLYERTKWIGDKNQPLPPDHGLEPTSAADFWNLRRANERRRELEEEERRELEEEERRAAGAGDIDSS